MGRIRPMGRDSELLMGPPYPLQRRRRSLLTLPFRLIWAVATRIERAIGILLLLVLGVLFMVIGLALCATIIGCILGIPLFIVGLLLTLRGLY